MARRLLIATCLVLLPLAGMAGALRVGPTRLDLSARHPVAVLEVQNTGSETTLAQLDAFAWTQAGIGDLLEATSDLITTPLVINLAAGETRLVRVGLGPGALAGQPNPASMERSYRVFVREVPPAVVPEGGLHFAVRIGVPVFAAPAESRAADGRASSDDLTWRWLADLHGCASVQFSNTSARHERVLSAEMLSSSGEILWRSSEPVYVLAGSKRAVPPALCAPSLKEAATLRLVTESHTLTLPAEAPSLIVDANPP